MLSLLNKLGSFFWRRADTWDDQKPYTGSEIVRDTDGVVTRFCNDYGMINDQIYFTNDVVIGREPLSIGQKVSVAYKEDKTSGGWKAIKVQCMSDKWEIDTPANSNALDLDIKVLVGTVTFCNKDGGEINQTTCFSTCDACEGYIPYKGDWVKAEYFINPSTWNSEACSVKPLRCKRVDKVKVSAFYGMTGVIDESIFFTMDSVRLPEGYKPQRNDLVNTVVVESSQSCYVWRALCIAPAKRNSLSTSDDGELDSQYSAALMMNKGGLEVSRMTHFGVIKQGQSKALQICIENNGNNAHSLVACKVAGLEKENKFKFKMCISEPNFSKTTSPSLKSFNPSLKPGQMTPSLCNVTNAKQDENEKNEPLLPTLMTSNRLPLRFYHMGCYMPYVTSGYYSKCMSGSVAPLEAGQYFYNGTLKSPLDVQSVTDNQLTTCNAHLTSGNITACNGCNDLDVNNVETPPSSKAGISDAMVIPPGEKTFIAITCEARNPGRSKELVLFCFQDFVIGRYIEATIESEEEYLLLPPTEFTSRNNKIQQVPKGNTVVLSAPQKRSSRRQLPSFIPLYPIPERLRKCVEQNLNVLAVEPCLGEILTLSNYRKKMSTLLWLEDIHNEIELKELGLSGVCLQKRGGFLLLQVPGIIEGRPSLFPGDKVLLKYQAYTTMGVEFAGTVVEIHNEEVTLRVNSNLEQSYNFEPMEVEFTVNRVTSRRCQFAVEQAEHLGQAVLFPETVILQSPQVLTTRINQQDCVGTKEQTLAQQENECVEQYRSHTREKNAVSMSDMVTVATQTSTQGKRSPVKKISHFFNPMLNDHQKLAVKRILSGECRPTPYILFGPPGTGKTVTVIEAILQIHYALSDSRILVCAPSNSAADLVCLRLHESGQLEPGSMVRVNASSRQEESISDLVKPYCGPGEDIQKATRFRIIISTCSSTGMFYQIGLRVGHFTHVFIDEAGQASESECLIPLGLVSEVTGEIILAGDPMQLGPVIKSRFALAYGLNISLLERLMALPIYLRDEETYGACGNYNPLLITKLMKNYRSHATLLHLPSKLFYHKELEVCADPAVVNRLLRWDKLPKKGFPLIFHGVRGTEMREGSNPSWFNPSEAVQVMRYCCILAKHVTTSVSAKDIGVITPYRKQGEKIRTLLRTVDLMDLKVGSVEEFQGQEYLVIIISMVRSCEESSYGDERSLLGFLSNPKRFNVATTRPKALLIVLGNPHILVKDPCACALLEYSIINGAYTGCNLPPGLESLQQCD
ncbi:RNA helicase Mov10l1 isoform X2 [Mixophyes fleayi]|uniref:RNA helicase Mov10l1 isoform X2 n=1 Tax=Mixophyes fleayi TaxID=3061075 RepID=UPI003F4E2F44